jgi:DNA-binding protein HU-beta
MIKIDIANVLMQTLPVSKATALQVVDLITDRMKTALLDGDRIELRGFGVFELRRRKSGVGRNIKTGATVAIPKGKTVRFKPGKDLREIDAEGVAELALAVEER